MYRTINGSFFNVSFHSDKLRPKISGAKGVAERPGFINSTCVPAGASALPDPADASEDQRALLDIGDVERCDEAVAQVEKDVRPSRIATVPKTPPRSLRAQLLRYVCPTVRPHRVPSR